MSTKATRPVWPADVAQIAGRRRITPERLAAEVFVSRRDRDSHPDGYKDGGGRWYPSDHERHSCCYGLREPSRAWPWSQMQHCRTMQHICCVVDADETEVRALLHEIDKATIAADAERRAARAKRSARAQAECDAIRQQLCAKLDRVIPDESLVTDLVERAVGKMRTPKILSEYTEYTSRDLFGVLLQRVAGSPLHTRAQVYWTVMYAGTPRALSFQVAA